MYVCMYVCMYVYIRSVLVSDVLLDGWRREQERRHGSTDEADRSQALPSHDPKQTSARYRDESQAQAPFLCVYVVVAVLWDGLHHRQQQGASALDHSLPTLCPQYDDLVLARLG